MNIVMHLKDTWLWWAIGLWTIGTVVPLLFVAGMHELLHLQNIGYLSSLFDLQVLSFLMVVVMEFPLIGSLMQIAAAVLLIVGIIWSACNLEIDRGD
jgi:hypothetical protein